MNSYVVRACRCGGNWYPGYVNLLANNGPANGNANYGGDLWIPSMGTIPIKPNRPNPRKHYYCPIQGRQPIFLGSQELKYYRLEGLSSASETPWVKAKDETD